MQPTAARSPTLKALACEPTSVTTPTISWPVFGRGRGRVRRLGPAVGRQRSGCARVHQVRGWCVRAQAGARSPGTQGKVVASPHSLLTLCRSELVVCIADCCQLVGWLGEEQPAAARGRAITPRSKQQQPAAAQPAPAASSLSRTAVADAAERNLDADVAGLQRAALEAQRRQRACGQLVGWLISWAAEGIPQASQPAASALPQILSLQPAQPGNRSPDLSRAAKPRQSPAPSASRWVQPRWRRRASLSKGSSSALFEGEGRGEQLSSDGRQAGQSSVVGCRRPRGRPAIAHAPGSCSSCLPAPPLSPYCSTRRSRLSRGTAPLAAAGPACKQATTSERLLGGAVSGGGERQRRAGSSSLEAPIVHAAHTCWARLNSRGLLAACSLPRAGLSRTAAAAMAAMAAGWSGSAGWMCGWERR